MESGRAEKIAFMAGSGAAKQIHALLVVMPVSEKYLGMLHNVFPRNAKLKPGLVPLDLAGAIAAAARANESYGLPKGTVRGSPAIPDEDLTTLRVPFYLVANKKLADGVVAALAKTIMEVRRDLVGEYPLVAQASAPSARRSLASTSVLPMICCRLAPREPTEPTWPRSILIDPYSAIAAE